MFREMKFILLSLCLSVLGCAEKKTETQTLVERGKYLVTVTGCHDCHTPKIAGPGGSPVMDEKRLRAGHPENAPYPTWSPQDMQQRNALALTNTSLTAWAGPWGVSFAINLTPDKETGIAEWSEDNFIKALRTGKHQGQPNGRDILPPMPWEDLKALTDDDIKAVFAYLRSLPPVKNQVPLPVLPSTPPADAKP
jgi:mono/diheme cytochrome c family protein